jgi:hypothetical protein
MEDVEDFWADDSDFFLTDFCDVLAEEEEEEDGKVFDDIFFDIAGGKIVAKKGISNNGKLLVEKLNFSGECSRTFCLLGGGFVFCDFIAEIFYRNKFKTEHLFMATLSLNKRNAESIYDLVKQGFVGKVSLVVSNYFYAHEKKQSGVVPYILDLFKETRGSLCLYVVRSHCKIYQFETYCGKHITIHGSSNLRSSDCIEQIVIEQGEETYDMFNVFFDIIKERNTIRSS